MVRITQFVYKFGRFCSVTPGTTSATTTTCPLRVVAAASVSVLLIRCLQAAGGERGKALSTEDLNDDVGLRCVRECALREGDWPLKRERPGKIRCMVCTQTVLSFLSARRLPHKVLLHYRQVL